MTKTNKIITGVIAFAAVIFFLFVGVLNKDHNFKQDVKAVTEAQGAPVQHKKDADGYDMAYIEQHYISREAADILWKKKLDSVAKANGIKARQITDHSEYSLTKTTGLKGVADTPRYIHDTMYMPFTLNGDNIHIDGAIAGTEATGTATVKLHLEKTNYWRKKWFLGDYHFYESFKGKDKDVVIDSIMNLHVAEAELSRWSIGVFGGLDVFNMKPAAGVALNYDLLRFKKRKKKVK